MGEATREQIEKHIRLQPNAARAWLVAERTARYGRLTEAEAEVIIGTPKPPVEVLRAENEKWTAERDARRAAVRAAPQDGVGSEIKATLSSWGYEPKPDCECLRYMRQWNRWGTKGCRKRFNQIVGVLKDAAAEEGGWMAWAADKLHLIPGVVERAIRAAEAKGL